MHYQELAEEIAAEFGYNLDEVVDDLFAVMASHRWNPAALSNAQVEKARFETISRLETINSILEKRSD